ncbi:hypothetical protein [Actinoplanes sp. L3-i22]|uniref:hypothetical protein n=1 Tax=Actinoplanes sp. L3-i22 TaxID=2836373 RepID=UPI001C76AA14|nr:hypothetical protein [Actinoplanes sp. L3-i22]BCY10941.1 hypothetical protein L3i22_060290 [Actinoplanes sp. L3-i22]
MSGSTRWDGSGRIAGVGDALAALQRVNADAERRGTTGALAHAVQPAGHAALDTPDITRLLPAFDAIRPLLPWAGLRRGATVAVASSTTLLQLLLAAAMREGAWACVTGMPGFGVLAAAENGIPLDRLALVPDPGPDWPSIVAALIDGVDLVAVRPPGPVSPAVAGRLAARARQRGTVLLPIGEWPGADVTLRRTGQRWEGLGGGHGRLRTQITEVQADGRGRAARSRTATIVGPATPSRPPFLRPSPVVAVSPPPAPPNELWAQMQPSPVPVDPWEALRRAARTGSGRQTSRRAAHLRLTVRDATEQENLG